MGDPVPSNISLCVNLDSTRPDVQDLLAQLNPILQQIVDIVQNCPDPSSEGVLAPNFSKILFSKIKTS
ncbi:MAG TPA: hypothetical protein VMU45_14145 [Candidatus Eisenbacteria bacterium]|nr:hypothetical protein [Candidatus Eisenbacteria bacterium]